MSQQNDKLNKNSTIHLPTENTKNEIELKRRDLDDGDTGDIKNHELITENKAATTTTTTITTATKQKQCKDKTMDIIQNGIDECKEFLTTIKRIFKL